MSAARRPRADKSDIASASVGQRAASTRCLVESSKRLYLEHPGLQRHLPGPVIDLLPISRRAPRFPDGDEEVVGHRQSFRR